MKFLQIFALINLVANSLFATLSNKGNSSNITSSTAASAVGAIAIAAALIAKREAIRKAILRRKFRELMAEKVKVKRKLTTRATAIKNKFEKITRFKSKKENKPDATVLVHHIGAMQPPQPPPVTFRQAPPPPPARPAPPTKKPLHKG